MLEVESRHWPQRAPSPPKGGEGRDEGGVPRVLSLWLAPSPRPSPPWGEREVTVAAPNLNLTPHEGTAVRRVIP